jgi:hypothetical protein
MPTTTVRREDVERRAYELYEQRGREDGRDWDDWLQAEREVLGADTQRESEAGTAPSAQRRRRAEREVEYA